jgi:arginine/lysine/ornithine decarboxylase
MCRLFRSLIFRPSVNADAGTLSKHHVNIHVNGLNVEKMLPAEGINGILFKAFLEHLAVIRKKIRLMILFFFSPDETNV